jgi:DNA repair photolyase
MRAIYQTSGRAREYSFLAANLYKGCPHGCGYCYVPDILHVEKEDFRSDAWNRPRDGILEQLEKDAKVHAGTNIRILLCFACDPYPADRDAFTTRKAIEIFNQYDIPFTILTKGGLVAARDFDLYKFSDAFSVTLTTTDEDERKIIEPGASAVADRIETLKEAHGREIFTWVSIEPAFDADRAVRIIEKTHKFTDHYKIGWLNHCKAKDIGIKTEKISYYEMGNRIIDALERHGKTFWIKREFAQMISSRAWKQTDTRCRIITDRKVMANTI